MKIIYRIIAIVAIFLLLDFAIDAFLRHGVEENYGLNQDSDILLIGHSHLMLAVDKEKLEQGTGLKVSKYCREGVNVMDRKVMIDHYLNNGHSDSLKYMLYGVDLCTFTVGGLSENAYTLFYPFMDNEYVDTYVKKQAPTENYWLNKIFRSLRYNDDAIKNSAFRGWLHNWDNYKSNKIDVEAYKKWAEAGNERKIKMDTTLMRIFDESIREVTDKGVKVILVNLPTLDVLNELEPNKFKEITDWFTDYANQHPMVEYWDFNPQYSSNHEIFNDRLHVNAIGQQIITDELIKKMNALK